MITPGLEKFAPVSHNETMKLHLRFPCCSLVIAVLALTFTYSAYADQIKVKKVKGNSAVVESDVVLEEGKTYDLVMTPVADNVDYKSNSIKVRKNSFSFGTDFEAVRSDLSQNTALNLQFRYGWNFANLEVGVSGLISTRDQGAGSTNSFLAGGYFDYNLVPNRDPKEMIYGPFILLASGSTQYPSSSTSGGSSTKIETNVGGFLTYFLGQSTTALRGEVFYDYQQINTTAQQNSVGGAGLRGLLVFYF
jgi:hypothetical protein